MDMSSMSGMGHSGHDMSSMTMSGGIFTSADELIARGFWYGVAGCVGGLMVIRIISTLQKNQRLRQHRANPSGIPSRPRGWLSQSYATATAATRELLYPQPVYFTGRFTRFSSPLPLGKWLTLAVYWVIILCFLWSNTILKPSDPLYPYKWEVIGFRAAWVTVTQIPFVYLLSCKFNPISILTGISYERFNWLHRWVARTVFLTAIVHWSTFYAEWSFYNMITLQFNLMPMVKYGFGAWGIITWMVLTGFGFFRNVSYELFVAQHTVAAAVLLWVLFVHVPSYAQYNIWLSVAFVAFDWGVRLVWTILRNFHILGRSSQKTPGYSTRLEALPGDVVRVTIDDIDFTWKAGQHVYISIPTLRPFETHPFTIANALGFDNERGQNTLQLLIQTRSGFSKSLDKAARKASEAGRRCRTMISGPWGNPPDISHYDTVVLVACSSGASFVVPLLQNLVKRRGCVREVAMHWIIRSEDHFGWFGQDLTSLRDIAQAGGLSLQITVHITGSVRPDSLDITAQSSDQSSRSDSREGSSPTSVHSMEQEKLPLSHQYREVNSSCKAVLNRQYGRPVLDAMVRPAVEQALGETAIVVCGGVSITAQCRTYVAALSDERAVHKGTGAQGIFLYTETYGW